MRDEMSMGGVKAGDSEAELTERLRALADENKNLRAALEAAQRLIEHRRSLDEVMAQALRDALGLGMEPEEPGDEAMERAREKLKEEIEELTAQREALGQSIEQDARALEEQLKRLDSSLKTASSLLREAQDIGRQLQMHLSSLAERLEQLEVVWQGVERVAVSTALPEAAPEEEGGEEVLAKLAEERPETEAVREEAAVSLPPTPTLEEEAELLEPRTTTLVVLGFQDVSSLRSFERAIGQVPGVVSVEPRRFSRGTLEVAVVHRGELALDLLAIPGFAVSPSRVAEGYLEFQLTSSATEAGHSTGHSTG